MFIWTLKASSIKFFAALLLASAVLITLIAVVPQYEEAGEVAVVTTDYTNIRSAEDRIRFLSSFGYTVDSAAEEQKSVRIPEEFDSAYTRYNDIQRAQGLNLKKYCGKTVDRFTYPVTSYEGYDGPVLVTLLISNGRVIGGDVCGIGAQTFVHGFSKE